MIKILLVSSKPDNLNALEKALAADPGIQIVKAATAEDSMKLARDEKPQLAVVDSALSGVTPEKLVLDFISVNAMMNTAVVSGLSDDEFHEKTEGLGILMRLPERPGPEDAARLLEILRSIIG